MLVGRSSMLKMEGADWQEGPEDELLGKELMLTFDIE